MEEARNTRTEHARSPGDRVEGLARADRVGAVPSQGLLEAARPLVCRWALGQTGDPDVAEDVAQEVLVRMVRGFGGWDGRGRFTTWLYRVVTNVVRDRERRTRRERTGRARLAALVDAGNPATAPELRAVLAVLGRVMDRLSPNQRAAFDLVDLQGFSGAEAAEMQEMHPSTFRVHLARARAAVRTAIQKEGAR